MTEPCELSATDARRLIGDKRLSPVELVESCIARIEAVDPALNAFVTTAFDAARREARAAEKAVMAGEALGALHGLPIGVKDLQLTEGLRTTFGSLLFEHNVPVSDGRMVAEIRRAGGIILGKTNTPEFGAGANTTNRVFGATGNPFDPRLTSGGSSGGTAAALATGMVPLATGSDFGGSVRTPAGFCGVVGIRPTAGVIPSETRAIGLSPFAVLAPMARNVADAALLLAVTAGYDPRDPFSMPPDPALRRHPAAVDLATLRVAFSADLGCAPMDAGVRGLFRRRMGKLAPMFSSCEERDPELGPVHEVFEILRGVTFIAAHKKQLKESRAKLGPNIIDNTERALKYDASDVAWASLEQTRLFRRFLRLFDKIDVLICPSCSVAPFPHDQLYVKEIDGREMDTYMRWLAITYGISMTQHPVVAIPCGVNEQGLPFGLQIIGRYRGERALLDIAHSIEQYLAGDPELARPLPDLTALQRPGD